MPDADDVVLMRFEDPDEVREMPFGRFELITVGEHHLVGAEQYAAEE